MEDCRKILIIHSDLGIGGAEKIIAFLAESLSKTYKVKLLLLKKTEITVGNKNQLSTVIEEKKCYSENKIFSIHFLREISHLIKMSKEIQDTNSKFGASIIICFDPRILLAICINRKLLKQSVIFSERTDPNFKSFFWKFCLPILYDKISFIVFQTKQAMVFYGKRIKNKSMEINNPALPRNFDDDAKLYIHKRKYIFSAGRFQYRKGFDILIKAFKKVHIKYPELDLIIFAEGQEKEKITRLILENKLNNNVIIENRINNVIDVNINAELFVLPSRSEGIPNILIEAFYAQIPSVCTDCSPGGARLISGDGKYCLLAKNEDVNDLANKIIFALDHKDKMIELAELAKKSLCRFDKNMIANQWRKVIDAIFEEKEYSSSIS